MTHTPGPWEYRPHDHDDWGIVRVGAIKGKRWGHVICQARNPDVGFDDLGAYREGKRDPYEANAHLIAAAPALLEALEALVGSFEKHRPKAYWDAARAAIALARGEAVK